MIRAFPLAAALALAGCSSQPAATGPQPNESAVEGALANEQDALETDIANDAEADARNEGAAAGATSYGCDDGSNIGAVYDDAGNVRLSIGERTITLAGIVAASGSKFRGNGFAPGETMTWWTKGDAAMLITAPRGVAEGSAREVMIDCQEAD